MPDRVHSLGDCTRPSSHSPPATTDTERKVAVSHQPPTESVQADSARIPKINEVPTRRCRRDTKDRTTRHARRRRENVSRRTSHRRDRYWDERAAMRDQATAHSVQKFSVAEHRARNPAPSETQSPPTVSQSTPTLSQSTPTLSQSTPTAPGWSPPPSRRHHRAPPPCALPSSAPRSSRSPRGPDRPAERRPHRSLRTPP